MALDWELLEFLCRRNLESPNDKLRPALEKILDNLPQFKALVDKLSPYVQDYDFEPDTPGHGGRTFLKLGELCMAKLIAINRKVLRKEWGFFENLAKELDAYTEVFMELFKGVTAIDVGLQLQTEKGDLFLNMKPMELAKIVNMKVRQSSFLGRCHSFQYCKCLWTPLKLINIFMVIYHQFCYTDLGFLAKCKNVALCFTTIDRRRDLILHTLMKLDVHFIKSLWTLSESPLLNFFKMLQVPKIAVDVDIAIPADPMSAPTADDNAIDIPIPSSHIGPTPMYARLMSARRRVGMIGSEGLTSSTLAPKSDVLFVHIHGGGFIALGRESCQKNLYEWATDLDVPILRIDYNHAPEAPFPRAIEDILYIYAWVLRHGRDMLGSTLKKIIVIGDSAGGNLVAALALKTIQLGIRKPDGILLNYPSLNVANDPSPSRVIGYCDPLLSFPITVRCFKAYASLEDPVLGDERIQELLDNPVEMFDFDVPKDPFLNPYIAPEEWLREMPPTKMVAVEMDFFLDDAVMFAKKLRRLGVEVGLDVLPDLPHGFLSFASFCKEAQAGADLCAKRLLELIT